MQEARILHCEDVAIYRQTIADFLPMYTTRHRIVSGAGDLKTTFDELASVQRHESDVNVLLLDGELTDGSARDVVQRVKKLGIFVLIIGLSGSAKGLGGQGLEVGKDLVADIPKHEFDLKDFVRLLDDLPEPRAIAA